MKIAIIGSGISGLAAAYLLNPHHDITLYEKSARAGGHARTLEIDYQGHPIAVDTGFIVFNYRNYPNLLGLFRHLGVAHHESNMSFAASIANGAFEYSSASVRGMFPNWQAMTDIKRYQMLRDYFRFAKAARAWMHAGEQPMTLHELLQQSGVGQAFIRYFMLPMGAAIWSCPLKTMLDYPARTFVRFFENHGLLGVNDQPQWFTVTGGSQTYVAKVVSQFEDKIRLDCGVQRVQRTADGVLIDDMNGNTDLYDQVVFASHADEALAMLVNPSEREKQLLSAFRFQSNQAYLHRDASLMPKNPKCWASWVYLSQRETDDAPQLAITYWMNKLQGLPSDCPLFVTLNPATPPAPELVFNTHRFTHPIFDQPAIDAQIALPEIQGADRIWYCGAWQRYGFHEDGIASAVAVATRLGATIPWA